MTKSTKHETTSDSAKARKPYKQPKVQKRRSMKYATLASGAATSGAAGTG